MDSNINANLINTQHNIGRTSRSFRGHASPISSHSFGRRLDSKQAALEDWESSFTQILSRTKHTIIKVNERYGSPHAYDVRASTGNMHTAPPAPPAPSASRISNSLEYLGIAPLRAHRVGFEVRGGGGRHGDRCWLSTAQAASVCLSVCLSSSFQGLTHLSMPVFPQHVSFLIFCSHNVNIIYANIIDTCH